MQPSFPFRMQNPTATPLSAPARPPSGSPRLFTFGVYASLAIIIAYATVMVVSNSRGTTQTTRDAGARIAVAASQPGTVEQIVRELLTYERVALTNADASAARTALAATVARYNDTLRAFDGGGRVTTADGKEVAIARSNDDEEHRITREALELWMPLQARLQDVSARTPPTAELRATIEATLVRHPTLVQLMHELAARAEISAAGLIRAAEGPRTLFIAVDSIALVMLPGFFIWSRMRRLRQHTETTLANLKVVHERLETQASELASAKHETDLIMDTVQEGLLLLDDTFTIGVHHSKALNAILRQEQLAGMNLLNLLQRVLSEKMFNVTKDYFALLFDPRRKERAVLQVNPLKDIEVSFSNGKGGFDNRYLGFNFRRIVEDKKVVRLFVTVRDVTQQVELERKLIESEKNKQRQLEILFGILHIDPSELETFCKLVETELNMINKTLRAEDFAGATGQRIAALRERLNAVFRSVHNVKGNACYLRLDYFQRAAEAFESKISELIERPVLGGDDFLAIVVAQAGMRADLADLNELRKKLSAMRQAGTAHAGLPEVSVVADGLRELVRKVSKELGKEAELQIDTYALNTVALNRKDLVRDVLIQLARNSLAHSIETPTERKDRGKPAKARISIRGLPRTADGLVGVAFRDDGRGLDLPKIRRRAEAAGLLQPEGSYSPAEVAQCIFAQGFSTADSAGAHAGRGMGMDIIKSKVIDENGGAIEVKSAPGTFCEFQIYFPETAETAAAAS
jgi:signal transduction histidine kinase